MNLGATLTQSARRWASKTALVFEGQRWTFQALNRLVNKTAHAFRADGVEAGERVAFLTFNRPEQVVGYYALLKLGAVPVPINYRLGAEEARYILNDSGSRGLVFEAALRALVAPIAANLETVR